MHDSHQRQLEESFFRLHPASLRRTAEFVADRVASNAIKKLQQTVLKAVMTECQQWASAETTSHLVTTPAADMLVSQFTNYWVCFSFSLYLTHLLFYTYFRLSPIFI